MMVAPRTYLDCQIWKWWSLNQIGLPLLNKYWLYSWRQSLQSHPRRTDLAHGIEGLSLICDKEGHLYTVMKFWWLGEEKNSSKWQVIVGKIGWGEFLGLGFLILGWHKMETFKCEIWDFPWKLPDRS